MPEKRRVRLQKNALRALDAARDAARRARGSSTPPSPASGAGAPAMPPVEVLRTTEEPHESDAPSDGALRSTPPRPRRGDARLGAASARGGAPNVPLTSDEAALIELVDRLAVVADGAHLAEIEISTGGTRVLVRSRAAVTPLAPPASSAAEAPRLPAAPPATGAEGPSAPQPVGVVAPLSPAGSFIAAPLTGVFYAAASPGADPLVRVGQVVAVGQPIGLIEAMKLFNEIKADKAGRVTRIVAENGRIVKAKAPIIEIEPA